MMPAAALFRAWRAEIVEELAAARVELAAAHQRLQVEEKRASVEKAHREQLEALVRRAVGGESISSAFRRRVEQAAEVRTAAVAPAKLTIETLTWRITDLVDAISQIDRGLRLEEPTLSAPAEAAPPPRGKAQPEPYEPIEMPPPRGAAS